MPITIKIFPPIGIARLHNSADEFFIGPETPNQVIVPAGGYKHATGRIKSQAARFRLFGWEGDAWRVKLANTKAACQEFIGVGSQLMLPRNPQEQDRTRLKILPGPRLLCGPNQSAEFDTVLLPATHPR